MNAYVAVTDADWYGFLSRQDDLDEVNFWQPNPWGGELGVLRRGEPLLFKLKAPHLPSRHSRAPFPAPRWLDSKRANMSPLDLDLLHVDPRKVRDYLLAPDHPEGGSKAAFFMALGFHRDRPWELAVELRALGGSEDAMGPVETRFGSKYIVDGAIRGVPVRTVWIVDSPGGGVRFVTAYPRRSPT